LADVASDCLGSADRFGKGLPNLDRFDGPCWVNWLTGNGERLVKAASYLRAETKCKRCPWLRQQIGDGLETKLSQFDGRIRREPERGQRKWREQFPEDA